MIPYARRGSILALLAVTIVAGTWVLAHAASPVTSIAVVVRDYVSKAIIPCGTATTTGQVDWNVYVTSNGLTSIPALHVEVNQPQLRPRGFLWTQDTYRISAFTGTTRIAYSEQWTGPAGDYYIVARVPDSGVSATCEIHKVAA